MNFWHYVSIDKFHTSITAFFLSQLFQNILIHFRKRENSKTVFCICISVPHHTRAQNNRKYYEKLLEEQRRKQYRRGEDGGEEDKTEEPNKYTERPLDEYRKSDEFQTYESLCRGEDTHVILSSFKMPSLILYAICLCKTIFIIK